VDPPSDLNGCRGALLDDGHQAHELRGRDLVLGGQLSGIDVRSADDLPNGVQDAQVMPLAIPGWVRGAERRVLCTCSHFATFLPGPVSEIALRATGKSRSPELWAAT
jgi:hypothetical protein